MGLGVTVRRIESHSPWDCESQSVGLRVTVRGIGSHSANGTHYPWEPMQQADHTKPFYV